MGLSAPLTPLHLYRASSSFQSSYLSTNKFQRGVREILEIRSFISSVLLKENQSAFPLCCQSHITAPSLVLSSTKGQFCCLGRKMLKGLKVAHIFSHLCLVARAGDLSQSHSGSLYSLDFSVCILQGVGNKSFILHC